MGGQPQPAASRDEAGHSSTGIIGGGISLNLCLQRYWHAEGGQCTKSSTLHCAISLDQRLVVCDLGCRCCVRRSPACGGEGNAQMLAPCCTQPLLDWPPLLCLQLGVNVTRPPYYVDTAPPEGRR